MAIINENGKLFGIINLIDFAVIVIFIAGVVGFFAVRSGIHVTSGQVIKGETDILIAVQVPKLTTLDPKLFLPGEKTSITIRNQPRGDVVIQRVESTPVRLTVMAPSGKAEAINDLAMANSSDNVIWLKDHAKITEDGYVTEGVKVKVGLPIELEGFKYRVYGKIVDVEAVK